MKVRSLDHLVLTVQDFSHTLDFYTRVLGMEAIVFGDNRHALGFGDQKINLHEVHSAIDPKAFRPTAGSGDLCFIVDVKIDAVRRHLGEEGVAIEVGPVERTGALGPMWSIYVRDPDGNLVELSSYDG
jgi:catechol 2,3-dioxygenase-like lactoylglutathione lyase family enzyme